MEKPSKKQLQRGMLVEIRLDKTTDYMKGFIRRITGGSEKKGVRVELTNGKCGYVERIVPRHEAERETFVFYNRFFHSDYVFFLKDGSGIWTLDRKNRNGAVEATGFLFSSEREAELFIKKMNIEVSVGRYPMKRTISRLIQNHRADIYYMDGLRKVRRSTLLEREEEFRKI